MPKHINIAVLLTPGTTTPIDIKNPHITKYKKFVLFTLYVIFFSIIIKIKVIRTEKHRYKRYDKRKYCFSCACFNSKGILPKIRPIKVKEVCTG